MKTMVRVPYCARAFGLGHDLLDLLDAGHDGGELDEVGLGDARDDLGERGFAGAGRSPEDHRAGVVVVDLRAQRLAGPEQMLLADELIERARPHAIGQRPGAVARTVAARDGLEQTHVRVADFQFTADWSTKGIQQSKIIVSAGLLRITRYWRLRGVQRFDIR